MDKKNRSKVIIMKDANDCDQDAQGLVEDRTLKPRARV